MNEFQENLSDTAERLSSERYLEAVRQRGGIFVEAVRVTRMPMVVTDPGLPGNPITFANEAFCNLRGYVRKDLLGQNPHFMNGPDTDPRSIALYEEAMADGRDVNLEILQYRKSGSAFHAMLFATPLHDGQGTVINHFLSFLDISPRLEAEAKLRDMAASLEARGAERAQALETANAALVKADAERAMLLVEVNHRAKNSLAVAAALLTLQSRRQADPSVKTLFAESADRLSAMASLHDLLSRSEHSARVDIGGYVAQLCEALRSMTAGDRISLRARVEDDILVDADIAFPMGIVLTELITNAIKYAFPTDRSGIILVQGRRAGPGRVELLVRDNGVGMSGYREGSLGYGLVRTLVKQVGGELDIQGDAGVTVTITFSDASRLTREAIM